MIKYCLATAIGATHIKKNKPNQDNIRLYSEDNIVVATVSDGHGGNKYFRSERGSFIACVVAEEVIADFLARNKRVEGLSEKWLEDKTEKEQRIKKNIIAVWREKVAEDIEKFPFSVDELASLSERERRSVSVNRFAPYGATLLAVGYSDTLAVMVKLGDGDIVTLDIDGLASEPFSRDERLLANQTTSLCDKDVFDNLVVICMEKDYFPIFTMISTDGVSNAFTEEKDFFDFAIKLKEEFDESEERAEIESNLTKFLRKASDVGSGDDCSVVAINITNKYDRM